MLQEDLAALERPVVVTSLFGVAQDLLEPFRRLGQASFPLEQLHCGVLDLEVLRVSGLRGKF